MSQGQSKPRSGGGNSGGRGSGGEGGSGGGDRGRSRRRRRPGGGGGGGGREGQNAREGGSQRERERPEPEVTYKAPPVLKMYGVVFFDTHAHAREDAPRLLEMSGQFDQLNIVVKAEGGMDDPELTKYGRVYAGEAWTLIHRRRVDDGWYNDKHE